MNKFIYTPIVFILSLTSLLPVVAAQTPRLLIAQVQTGSLASASEEFISFFNDSDSLIDASKLKLEYSSASSGSSWSTKATLKGLWYPHRYYLISSTNYLTEKSNVSFSPGLAKAGGHVRLSQSDNTSTIHDTVGWGTAVAPETKSTPAPAESQVLERISTNNNLQDTNNNNADFVVSVSAEAHSNNIPDEVVISDTPISTENEPSPNPAGGLISQDTTIATSNVTAPALQEITELVGMTQTLQNPQSATPVSDVLVLSASEPTAQQTQQNNDSQLLIQESTPTLPNQTSEEPPVADLANNTNLQPQVEDQPIASGADTPITINNENSEGDLSSVPLQNIQNVYITELYPNPKSPETDADNEFIELYNPNNSAISLNGYRLESGANYSYKYTLNGTIPSKEYLVIPVTMSKLVLSNTTSRARLIGQNGEVISETETYLDAKEGESWSLIQDKWEWTNQVTAGAQNRQTPSLSSSVNPIVPAILGVKASKAQTIKKSSQTNGAGVKTKTPSASKAASNTKTPKTATTKKQNTSSSSIASTKYPESIPSTSFLHSNILAGIGLLAVGYAVYEYREDIKHFIWKLRRNRSIRHDIRS